VLLYYHCLGLGGERSFFYSFFYYNVSVAILLTL